MISNKEFRQLQLTEMEILDEIDKFCQKNDINYFLVGGSCIGAIRHKGFIPWDDDIDIGMLREDYDRFIKEYKDNDKFFVQTPEKDKKYWNLYAKVRKRNTYVGEKRIEKLKVHNEIFIDIFPIDNILSDDYNKIKLRANLIKIIKSSLQYKYKVKKLSECNFKILIVLFSLLSQPLIVRLANKIMRKDNKKNAELCVSYLSEYAIKKEITPKKTFIKPKKAKFEDREYYIPNDPDTYLSNLYGDYMKIPPKDQRINHGVLYVSFDTKKK